MKEYDFNNEEKRHYKDEKSINRFLNIDHFYFHDFMLFFLIRFFCLTFSPFLGGVFF